MRKVLKAIMVVITVCMVLSVCGCQSDAEVASYNVSKAADQFEIYRRVVFYNGITNEYILMVEGYCSIQVDTQENQLELTVKTGDGRYLKHFLGLSDNVTYFAEQLQPASASDAQYRVVFKPSAIIPTVEMR